MGSDILITGSADLSPIERAVKGLAESFSFARAAVDILSDDVASKSGNMKQSLGIAKEAVVQFESEVRRAVSSGAIEGLSDKAKKELGELKHSLEQSASDYRLFKNQIVGMTKEMSDADKRRTEIAESLAKDRKKKDEEELAEKKRLAQEISASWKLAIAEEKDRNAEIRRQVKAIAADERELYLKKIQAAKEAKAAEKAIWEEALREDKDRNAKIKEQVRQIAADERELYRKRIQLAREARAAEKAMLNEAHGQAIAEDRRRTEAARRAAEEIAKAQKKEADSHKVTLASLRNLTAGYLSIGAMRAFIGATVDSAVALERVRNSLVAATGSLDGGAEAFAYTRKLAYGLGLELETLSKQYGLFSAAVKDSGFTQRQTRAIFESVAEASRVLGLSVEDMQGVFVALQQIATKGTVQMEELRQQLGDRLPGSVAIMAKALGVTQRELFTLTKQGLVPAKEALILFSEELRRALVDGSLGYALDGIQVKIVNLKNATFELKAAFGQGFAEGASAGMKDIGEEARRSTDSVKSLGQALGFVANVVTQTAAATVGLGKVIGISLGVVVTRISEFLNLSLAKVVEFQADLIASYAKVLEKLHLPKPPGLDDFIASAREGATQLRGMAAANDAVADSASEFALEIAKSWRGLGIFSDGLSKAREEGDRMRQSQKDLADSALVTNAAFGKGADAQKNLVEAIRKRLEQQDKENEKTLKGTVVTQDLTQATNEHETAIDKLANTVRKEQESIEGSIYSLTTRGVVLQEAIRLAEKDGVVSSAAADTIKQKVGEMYDAYERIGKAVPPWLDDIAAKYGAVSKAQQQFIDELTAAADKAEKRLTEANDRKRDSSGGKYGEMDLQDIEMQIADAKKKRDEAVSELLAATDAAGAKKAQKQVEEAEKNIEDRIKRREEILKKIESQNAADAAPDNKKKEELQKQADALRNEIANLEAKQANGSLSPEELDRLFSAKDALQDLKNEMGSIVEVQEQVHFGWNGITEGTDAATDAWEAYYALVDANAIKAKLALESQANAADDIRNSADGLEVTLTKVGDKWVIANEAGKAAADEMALSVEKVGDTWKITNKAAEELADGAGLAAEQIGLLAVESQKLEDIKPMQAAAEATMSMEQSLGRIVETHFPKAIDLASQLAAITSGIQLGGGASTPSSAGSVPGYVSDVAGQ